MAEFFSLKDNVAVITGGTSGIGLKAAERFIAAGAKVVIAGRKDGTEIAEKIGATFVQCDVSNEESVAALMKTAQDTYGNIDIIVNNAGANFGYDVLMETDIADFDKNFNINTKGVVFGIKYGVPRMNDGGRIVNVSSVAGLQGAPYVPLGRIAEPEEIASMIHFLASTDCNFITGQAIAVDGGFTAGMSITAYNTLAAE
jgi:NAD(P)-dependent dehydrogenase (short-subunit alcohol dehydrogenase family)